MSQTERLKKLMERAENGETLTIGFLGGSITQGSLASSDKRTYAYHVLEWWKEQFPKAEFHYVNGGIGGTTSHFGVARAAQDLLMYRPDFVVIDFTVNDDPEDVVFFQETFEGVLRKVYYSETKPAVIVLNNVYYDTGINVQDAHNAVADYYQIPHVSVKDTILPRIVSGEWKREELTPDNLHPNDQGHALVAGEICNMLQQVKEANRIVSEQEEIKKDPMTPNAYEQAKRLTIANANPKLDGFRADCEEKLGHLDFFKNGWIGRKKGDTIQFRVHASCIAVQYRKTIHRPAPVAQLILDKDTAHPVTLDSNFEEDWGDCLYLQTILHHGEAKEHTIDITITETAENQQADFYLLSLILA
ncbi:MAG: SGNH/GDSL hydrolase family protein [Lachnospiraceae bacterium]